MTTDRHPVLDPASSNYVLPSPPRQGSLFVSGEEPASLLQTQGVARALGERFRTQAESLQLFLSEVRERLEQLDTGIAEDSRAQLKGAVRELVRVVDWCDAVQGELLVESEKAVAGLEPIDLVELCEQQAASRQVMTDPIAVVASRAVTIWGDRAQLAHLIQKALALVWARTSSQGMRCIEVDWVDGLAMVRICSRGEPAGQIDPEIVDRFRDAASQAAVSVVPDAFGPGGAGLVLRLPA